jgi:hypothetical protein
MGNDSATDVLLTLDPSSVEKVFYDEYLVND